jgi:hypothetical protein
MYESDSSLFNCIEEKNPVPLWNVEMLRDPRTVTVECRDVPVVRLEQGCAYVRMWKILKSPERERTVIMAIMNSNII